MSDRIDKLLEQHHLGELTEGKRNLVKQAALDTIDAILADPRLILFRGYRLELVGVAFTYWGENDGRPASAD